MSTAKTTRQFFDTTVEICCHRVALHYWDFTHELTDELKEILIEEGEKRAKHCIIDGYREGTLYCYIEDNNGSKTISGWWEIERD